MVRPLMSVVLMGLLLWGAGVGVAAERAQDPMQAAPHIYKSLLENPHVRVLDVRFPAGQTSPMHNHPDYVVYCLSDGRVRFTSPTGQESDFEMKTGQAFWRSAENHSVRNVGSTEARVLNIELRRAPVAAADSVQKHGEDAVKVAPKHYRVLLDNQQVRVMEGRTKPGEKVEMHSHPAHLVYVMSPCTLRATEPDGNTIVSELKAGQCLWARPTRHSYQNIGSTESHMLVVEIKPIAAGDEAVTAAGRMAMPEHPGQHVMLAPDQLRWQPAPAGLPAGAQMAVMGGDPSKPGPFTLRAKFPAGYTIRPHWHPADEHVTVVSGSLYMGMGEVLDKSKARELPAGSFAMMPAKSPHYAFTEKEAVIQLHGMGPWGINYINRSDDPRQ